MDWMERGLTHAREHSVIVSLTQPSILDRRWLTWLTIIFCDDNGMTTRGNLVRTYGQIRPVCTWKMTGLDGRRVDFYGAKLSQVTKG